MTQFEHDKQLVHELVFTANRILFEAWDPIGVNDTPEFTRDEYHTYAARAVGMAINGASAGMIARELAEIRSKSMCIGRTKVSEIDLEVAASIWWVVEHERELYSSRTFTRDPREAPRSS